MAPCSSEPRFTREYCTEHGRTIPLPDINVLSFVPLNVHHPALGLGIMREYTPACVRLLIPSF